MQNEMKSLPSNILQEAQNIFISLPTVSDYRIRTYKIMFIKLLMPSTSKNTDFLIFKAFLGNFSCYFEGVEDFKRNLS